MAKWLYEMARNTLVGLTAKPSEFLISPSPSVEKQIVQYNNKAYIGYFEHTAPCLFGSIQTNTP